MPLSQWTISSLNRKLQRPCAQNAPTLADGQTPDGTAPMTPADYDAWYDTPRGRWIGETEYRLLRELLAPQADERILDVGCGTGWFARQLAQRENTHLTGIDLAPASLVFARTRAPEASYLAADAQALPFADASFDKVMSITALCFIPDWPHALAEIIRVCRTRFVVGLLNRHSLLWRDKGRHGGSGAYRGAYWHTADEVCRALAALPVNDISVRTAVMLPSGTLLARQVEAVAGNRTPFGSFLAIAGNKAR